MVVLNVTHTAKADAGKAILELCKHITNPDPRRIGSYRGFDMELGFDVANHEFFIILKGTLTHRVPLGQDANGIITRLDNMLESFPIKLQNCKDQLVELHKQIENAKAEVAAPFSREAELSEKVKRLDELNSELNMDKRESELVDGEEEKEGDEEKEAPVKDCYEGRE